MCGMPNYMYVFIGVSLLISPGVNLDREAFDPCLHGCKCETVLATNVTYEAHVQKERFQSVDCEYSNLKLRSGFQGELAGLPGDEDDYAELVRSLPNNATALVLSNFSHLEISKVSIQSSLRLLNFTVDRCLGVTIFSSAFRGKLFNAVRNIQVSNSQMKLSNIKEETFLYLRYLEKIAVVRNMFLSKIETKAFRALPQIRVINLSTNGIDEIQPGAFYNLSSLTTLDLSYNFLKTIPGEDILKLSVSSLQSLDFKENKWNCSCEMSWILVLSRSVFANPSQVLCSYPSSLYGIALQDLKPKNFEHCCPVELMSYVQYVDFLFSLMCAAFFGIILFINTPTPLWTNQTSTVKCGQVQFSTRNPLGRNVFRGKMLCDGRDVAIKKVPCMKQETQSLQELKIRQHMLKSWHHHANVIQYIMTEYDPVSSCAYIVLELCDGNLRDQEIKPSKDCLLQITKGLSHIHDCEVEHRDIKPANILYKVDAAGEYRFIVADFDLGHRTEDVSSHRPEYGTRGWSAPELWKQGERTTAVDIFSLGCVFFYVLTRGGHPFASSRDIAASELCMDAEAVQGNIQNNQFSLEGLGEHCDEVTAESAKDLVESMIQNDPDRRPEAKEVLEHPLFWDAAQQRHYFVEQIGPYMDRKQDFKVLVDKLEQCRQNVFQDNWMDGLDEAIKKTVEGVQKHKSELCQLVREVRNKIVHFKKLKPHVQAIFYGSPEGVVRYFNSQFPKLLVCTYKACKEAGVTW